MITNLAQLVFITSKTCNRNRLANSPSPAEASSSPATVDRHESHDLKNRSHDSEGAYHWERIVPH